MRKALDRRAVVAGAVGGSLAAAMAPTDAQERDGAIPVENRLEGSREWQLTRVRIDGGKSRSPWIEGYCSHQSVAAGESLEIFVSTRPARRFLIDLFRMGYYGGKGARKVAQMGPFNGAPQPDPEVGPRRLRECRWEPAARLSIPADWPSGVYLGKLRTLPDSEDQPYWESYIVFIVRPSRPVDVLFQCSDNTWQAYNRWPDRFSLYDDGSAREWTSAPGYDVTFDRPYGKYRQILDYPQSVGSGEFLLWEYPLSYWLEREGYDVGYCSNSDLVTPGRVPAARAFLSVGHDEYWDVRQYHTVKKLSEEGTSLLFLSGNTLCWVSPFGSGTSGRPLRTLTRSAPYVGYAGHQPENGIAFAPTGPDEGLLMGARNIRPVNGGGDWRCELPDHWLFEGTGMKRGDVVPGLVGWEYHGNPADLPGLEVVASGFAFQGGENPQRWTATVHPTARGGYVFNAATIFWSQGLAAPPGHVLPWSHFSRPHGPDERVERMTRNLLRKALRG